MGRLKVGGYKFIYRVAGWSHDGDIIVNIWQRHSLILRHACVRELALSFTDCVTFGRCSILAELQKFHHLLCKDNHRLCPNQCAKCLMS